MAPSTANGHSPVANSTTRDTYASHFTLANLPYGIITTTADSQPQIATRLHDTVYSIPSLIKAGHFPSLDQGTITALQQPLLNSFAALPQSIHSSFRKDLQSLFKRTLSSPVTNGNSNDQPQQQPAPPDFDLSSSSYHISTVHLHVPFAIGDFTDFSSSRDHVLNASEAVTGTRKLPNSFLYQPVGYGGRCSSILMTGTDITRPYGHYFSAKRDGSVVYGLSQKMDFELEVACIVGKGSSFGEPVDINEVDEHIFGFVLLNDWSARDIQGLEMDPLGPLNGKSVGTTISPWVVTREALEPFAVPGPKKDRDPAPYLDDRKEKNAYSVNLRVDVEAAGSSTTVCKSNLQCLYWNFRDMIAHQTVNGCSLRTGDVLATGTVTGSADEERGCLLESTKGGKQSFQLADGASRTYLEDGDAVAITGWAGELDSVECVGFGECVGTLLANPRT